MINQQLLDFIKSQLLKGVDKETIIKDLSSGGWTTEDIEEGFDLANAKIINLTGNSSTPIPPTIDVEKYNKGKAFTIMSSIIVVIIASNLIFGDELQLSKDYLLQSIKKSKTEIIDQIKNNENTEFQVQKETSDSTEGILKEDIETNKEDTVTPTNTPVVTNNVTTTKTVETNKKDDLIDINIKTDVTQTVDCGSEDCFHQKFAVCQPSTLKADAGFASVEYKIIGPATGGCKMTFQYTTNPNPDWVNKEMTCTFDNKISFDASIEKVFNGVINGSVICSGPLYTILTSM